MSHTNPSPIYQAVTDTNMEFEAECREGQVLFAEKNAEYDSAFRKYGVLGVVMEIMGVVNRLPPMVIWQVDHGRSKREKLIDVFRDLHNFAVMALLCLGDDNWDGRKIEGDQDGKS